MAFMAVLESDLRALSAEARRRYPAVKDGAEHAILKLRSLSSPSEIADNEDILRIFLMACEVRTVKLSVIGLSCLQKLISHDAVAPSALKEILSTLKDHAEMADESVQLKTLQTILIIFQSRLHPENEANMAQALHICLRLLENNRSSDSVRNTAAATFRQAVALIFDHVVHAESLPVGKFGSGSHISRSSSVTGDVNRSINNSESWEHEIVSRGSSLMKETLTVAGELGLRLLEDLTALAAGGSAIWLRVNSLQRIFALDILEFILSNYVVIFKVLVPYEQVLRHQICSLLMTSLRTNAELEGEAGEPSFRRLVLRSVAHIIRLYSSSLITEAEVFLSMLVKVTFLDLPLWHRILVLEILRGFCVEARTLRTLFQNFDMHPKNTNVVEGMVKALARVVSNVQVQETSEESLAAVAGMFSSKAKGIEWILDNDASNAAVLVASEAHAITLAVEGLLGVVFTVATLTDEAVDSGEKEGLTISWYNQLESPRSEYDPVARYTGKTAVLCIAMVDSLWLTILDALSLILSRSQGEAIVLEILKGYQAFTQACGVLHAVEPLNSFLASLCKFTINFPNEVEKRSAVQSPGSKRSEASVEQRDSIVLTQKNVQALRTLFNVAHRLHNVLGPSWVLVLETLSALDRTIHSLHATTQDVSTTVPKLARESSGYSDFSILSSLNSQKLFESSALMHISAVKSLLSALCQLSHQCMLGASGGVGLAVSQKIGSITFSVEKMISILVNNLHRVQPLWDHVVGHFLELADNSNQHLRNMALDALDQSICAVLGSEQFQDYMPSRHHVISHEMEAGNSELKLLECSVISPLRVLYSSTQSIDVRARSLKILLHVLEVRIVVDVYASEKDLVTLGFQNLRVIMNDGLSSIPADCLHVCVDVTGAYSAQKTELNISLTAIGLLWTTTDFVAKGLLHGPAEGKKTRRQGEANAPCKPSGEAKEVLLSASLHSGFHDEHSVMKQMIGDLGETRSSGLPDKANDRAPTINIIDRDKLLFSVFSLLQTLGADDRPEVRNAAVRTLFQTLGSHGQKLSKSMWEDCLWNYVFPAVDRASHMAATSSKDEWQGKELGTRGGKAVHMLIHHSRNTVQKQWDETLVLVLGGIARLLRSFFPFLSNLSNFWSGWESLLLLLRNSILNGSKEVAIAAINCLQTTVLSHCSKGNLPLLYLNSILDVYGHILQKSPNYNDSAASKVKQEILHGLGELYVQAQMMFDDKMFSQLLATIDMAVKEAIMTNDNFENEFGHVPPVLRTVLEILPLLCPTESISSMWPILLRELLQYLPKSDSSLQKEEDDARQASFTDNSPDDNIRKQNEIPNGTTYVSPEKAEDPSRGSGSRTTTVIGIPSYLFAEKLVPVLVDLLLQAPIVEKHIIFPEIIQTLGSIAYNSSCSDTLLPMSNDRGPGENLEIVISITMCMTTRRDNPDGSLWRVAVEGFNRIIVDDVCGFTMNCGKDSKISKTASMRIWKEVADVYEIFLVGYCGRAIPSNSLSSEVLKADEALEMTILNILGDQILKSPIDAPSEILLRLISTMDRCASRTCSLPVETVELMPSHCRTEMWMRITDYANSKNTRGCGLVVANPALKIEGCEEASDWNMTRCEVSKISIVVLLTRCEYIFQRFLIDENDLGERPLPTTRLEEIIYVLQELTRLIIHSETASVLPLHPYLRSGLSDDENHDKRPHLFALFPSFCELVITREARVRELVQVLLRLITRELALEKVSSAG
ncbi:unnamed protein product [Dovyalis caffra]|uniref:Protein MON2 homolog n=1 Tax=Dovyalis caffra TaxID=77055 RepID=A0AAV1RZY8_9ROSI|nr:unnamed protein product [Dovyalis caffra]